VHQDGDRPRRASGDRSTSDLVRVSRDIIDHRMHVNPRAKPRKLKLQKISKEKVEAVKAKVMKLLDACFIRVVTYPK
jgi:hypothetical protein